MQTRLMFSEHAITRMAQRRLSVPAVEYVIDHGRRYYSGGVLHCFLGRRDIPQSDCKNDRFAKLEGATVLLDPVSTITVITVYRNRAAPKKFTRKTKYNLRASRLTGLSLVG